MNMAIKLRIVAERQIILLREKDRAMKIGDNILVAMAKIQKSGVHLEKVNAFGGRNLLHGPIIGEKKRQNKSIPPGWGIIKAPAMQWHKSKAR